jgi:quercetin dioxygenase-like cupin family protein
MTAHSSFSQASAGNVRWLSILILLPLGLLSNAIHAQTSIADPNFGVRNHKSIQPDKEFDNVLAQKLYTDPHATGFVIWVKQRVPLHKHASHSETVIILEGKGEMQLGGQIFPIRKGDIVFIPEGTPHAVTVTKGILKALSVQSPEFDGTDRVLLEK